MKLLPLLMLLFPVTLLAQTNFITGNADYLPPKTRKIYIGATFSPDFCHRVITKEDASMTPERWEAFKNFQDSIVKPILGYTAGIQVYYQIKPKLSVELGFQYSRKGYQWIPFPTIYNIMAPPALATHSFHFSYLDIPLRVNYTFLPGRFQIIAGAGAVFNYLLDAYVKTVPEDVIPEFQTQTYNVTDNYHATNISPTVSLGVKYNINNRMNLRAEPTFRYAIKEAANEYFMATHLWTVGLHVSFNYGF